MKIAVVLGIALLCLSQVSGEKDVLKSVFKEKVQNLSEKRAAAAPLVLCDANELVASGSEIIKNTLDIAQNTFGIAYTLLYPTSAEAKCDLGTWRCYIKEFVQMKDAINLVRKNLTEYAKKSHDLVDNVKEYFENCMPKK